jgi:hypothetical protein
MNSTDLLAAIEKLPIQEQEEVLTELARKIIARHELALKSETRKNFYFDGKSEMVIRQNVDLPGLIAKP